MLSTQDRVFPRRYALLAAICIVALACLVPASGTFASSGVHVHKRHHHKRHHHGKRARRARCSARAARARHVHARRSSFHSGGQPNYVLARPHCGARHRAAAPHKAAQVGPAAANSSSTCTDADLTPTPDDLDRVRGATLCLVNRERAGHGESALVDNGRLAQAAQAHSDDMAGRDYFDHVSPGGGTPLARMRACGYIYSSRLGYEVGENIGWGTLWLATPRAIVAAWMNSPEHRANILNSHYRDTAIGVVARPVESLAHGQTGAIYTQDFGLLITA